MSARKEPPPTSSKLRKNETFSPDFAGGAFTQSSPSPHPVLTNHTALCAPSSRQHLRLKARRGALG
jgi:hypothetical protein